MKTNFAELDKDLREILAAMTDFVKAEFADYERGLIAGAFEAGRFTGEWDHDVKVLETLHDKVRLEAAEAMQRNTSTWSGGKGEPNNVMEGIRHAVASEKFAGGMNYSLYSAYKALDFNA